MTDTFSYKYENPDSKTSKRIVTGLLKLERTEVNDRFNSISSNPVELNKLSRRKKHIEESITKGYEHLILGSHWYNRTFCFFCIEPISSKETRPNYGVLTCKTYNSRSDYTKDVPILVLTTHSMERLLERRKDTRLILLLKEELTLDFIFKYIDEFKKWVDNDYSEKDFKLATANGIACLHFTSPIPVL